jgi:Protein of unknown function (DUF3060)
MGGWSGPSVDRSLSMLRIGMWLIPVVIMLVVVGGAVFAFAGHKSRSSSGFSSSFGSGQSNNLSVPQGGTLSVGGNSNHKTIACNDGTLTLSGNSNTFTVTGHCVSLDVSGVSNNVTVDKADAITASGISNTVIFHNGAPTINQDGISVTVSQG